jgi:cysteine protease ATG4
VRHLLDTEAQPDKCPDTMWVMGRAHPGWRPSTPVEQAGPFFGEMEEIVGKEKGRRGSGSSGKPSPPSKEGHGTLRPTTWKRKDSQPTSPPAKGFGNLFSTSTLSLALPSAVASPTKEGEKPNTLDSPNKGKKKQEKEVLKWPDQCEPPHQVPSGQL